MGNHLPARYYQINKERLQKKARKKKRKTASKSSHTI